MIPSRVGFTLFATPYIGGDRRAPIRSRHYDPDNRISLNINGPHRMSMAYKMSTEPSLDPRQKILSDILETNKDVYNLIALVVSPSESFVYNEHPEVMRCRTTDNLSCLGRCNHRWNYSSNASTIPRSTS